MLRGGEQGVTLVETLVALAIFGLVGVVFLGGLTTSSYAVIVSQERVAAESLAKSQIDYIKSQGYIMEGEGSYELIDVPADLSTQGYTVEIIPQVDLPSDGDENVQRISVTVKRHGNTVLTLTDYKVNR